MRYSTALYVATLIGVCAISPTIAFAQEDDLCPSVIDEAVTLASSLCQEVGRNQVCYGNPHLSADPQPEALNFAFEEPGDIQDVNDIAALKLDPFDADDQTWGVALMRLQANLPDTLPGQNVTVLLFGDVEIRNAVDEPAPTLTVTAASGVNVRSGPSTGDAIISGLRADETASADGRLADNSWLRIELSDGRIGWVSAQFVTLDGDVNTLAVRAADDTTPRFRHMQAFYFRSGIGSPECAGRIDSGMMIQTPGGTREIVLTINEVNIRLTTTLFFQTTPDNYLVISALKGKATVEVQGVTQTVEVGKQVIVPLGENLAASAPPSEPQPITDDAVGTLPFDLLPFEVDLSQVLTATPAPGATAESTPPPGSGAGPTGQEVGVLRCSNQGQMSVPAGQPLVFRFGWATTDASYLNEYLGVVTNTLTFDGQAIPLARVARASTLANYYWAVPAPSPGSHQMTMSMALPHPIADGSDSDGDGQLDLFGSATFSCTVVVE